MGTQAEQLRQYFPRELVKRVQGMDYIPIAEVIARVNRVIGPENWSFKITDKWRENAGMRDLDNIVATVLVTATVDGVESHAEGIGGQRVEYKKNADIPVDLGNAYKSAVSDAIKKAWQQGWGVGLELARDDAALDYEESLYDDDEPYDDAPAPAADYEEPDDSDETDDGAALPERPEEAVTEETWARFNDLFGDLNSKERALAQNYWMKKYPNSEPPRFSTATEEQIEDFIVELVRIKMKATAA